jgi:hypothetical protein
MESNNVKHIDFEVLTAVVMKNSVILDIRPCSSSDVSEEHVAFIFRVEE